MFKCPGKLLVRTTLTLSIEESQYTGCNYYVLSLSAFSASRFLDASSSSSLSKLDAYENIRRCLFNMQLQPFFLSSSWQLKTYIPSAKNCATYAEVNLECIKLMPSSTLHVCMDVLVCYKANFRGIIIALRLRNLASDWIHIISVFIHKFFSFALACSCSTYIDFATAVVALVCTLKGIEVLIHIS